MNTLSLSGISCSAFFKVLLETIFFLLGGGMLAETVLLVLRVPMSSIPYQSQCMLNGELAYCQT